MIQEALEMFAQILDEMVPIRDLGGMRQNLTHGIGKSTGPISADHLNFRVGGEPGLDRFGGAVRQEIEGVACRDVNQNRSILVSPTQGKIVYAQDGDIRLGRVFDGPQIAV